MLAELVKRYKKLFDKGKISPPGWSKEEVSFGLRINENGDIVDLIDLRVELNQSNLVARNIETPESSNMSERRGKNFVANFLCDKTEYILGIDEEIEKFEESKKFHETVLSNCNSPAAIAVKNFFKNWNPSNLESCEILQEYLDDLKQAEIVFIFKSDYAHEDKEIKKAWEHYQQNQSNDDAPLMQCLITGEKDSPIQRVHPAIKAVGCKEAAIISFNEEAFESYTRKIRRDKNKNAKTDQGFNAPVSKSAAFEYTMALNDLLSDSEHMKIFGDKKNKTFVVYWAEENSEECQTYFDKLISPDENIQDAILDLIMGGVKKQSIDFKSTETDYKNPFYILGLSPNEGRLSVRFFLKQNFGKIKENMKKYHDDFEIIKPKAINFDYISVWKILNATVSSKSKDKSTSPLMFGAVIKAIMTGKNYPVSLFQNAILRVKSDYDSTKELLCIRVAIIKAYLTRNKGRKNLVELDKNLNEPAYVLGRIFSVLESIQYFAMNENKTKKNLTDKIEDTPNSANQGINVTIKEKYFTSACAMPSRIFPVLHNLAIHHLRKLNTGLKISLENELTDLMEKIYEYGKFPNALTIEEQGMFILGYYHQRYIKKTKKEEKENG